MKTISRYEVRDGKIYVYTPYCDAVANRCRSWEGGAWVLSESRLVDVQERLGRDFADLVEVEVGEENLTYDQAQIAVGWYVLASRRSRDSRADIHAELVAGSIPSSGGSVKNPSVNQSKDARFRLWVPRDFAASRNLEIVTDPGAPPAPKEDPLAGYSDAEILAECTRRGLVIDLAVSAC